MALGSLTNNVAVHTLGGSTFVVYHKTAIVEFSADKIVLRDGGWRTRSTMAKMNSAAEAYGLNFTVHQKKGKWIVNQMPYYDGITLDRV